MMKGRIFYNNNGNIMGGIAIVVKDFWKDSAEYCFSDNSGRMIGINMKIEENEVVIIMMGVRFFFSKLG